MKMFDGYPLRRIKKREQLLLWGISPLIMQLIVGLFLSTYAIRVNPPAVLTEDAVLELVNVQMQRGFVIGSIISLPLLVWAIVARKIPLVNRKQVERERWFLFPGLEKKDWFFLAWYIPVSYILFTIGGIVIELIFGAGEAVNQEAIESMVGVIPNWALFVIIIIIAPVAEEWLFRGLVMFRHEKKEATWTATIISALIFGLVHTPTDISSFYSYVGLGLLFAYAAKHTKTVEAAIVYHLLNNILAFTVMMAL